MADLKNFLLWVLLFIIFIGIFDTIFFKNQPRGNDEENQIIIPSYDHNSFSVFPSKQE